MELIQTLGPMALASMLVGTLPLAMGVVYALRPSEQRLTLVRTSSLATVFATVSGTMLGFVYGLHFIARRQPGGLTPAAAVGLADSLVPLFFGFGCLTVAWLCVTIGLWRRTDLQE
jgi:hypothetical protein